MSDIYKESFEKTRTAGSIAAAALDEVTKIIKPGISTNEIDKVCYEFINDHNAYSAPLFYRGFPKSFCTSANHVICHGIPSDKILKDGDIINVDVTAYKDGWHGDTSRMFKVGEISIKAEKLIFIAQKYIPADRAPNIQAALKKISSKEKKTIVIFGSLYLVGDVLNKN